jgi:hypothetical protein
MMQSANVPRLAGPDAVIRDKEAGRLGGQLAGN